MRACLKILFVLLVLGLSLSLGGCEERDERYQDYKLINPSRDFTLKDQDGKWFHLKDHRDEVVLLFFGYISCPDVCPTTFSKLARVYTLLADKRQKVLTVFVSVDPERDTPEKLKEYLDFFNVHAVGLTGTKEEVDAVADAYKITYEKVDTSSALGYMINHTDYLFLIDKSGKVRYLFRPQDKAEKIAEVVKKQL